MPFSASPKASTGLTLGDSSSKATWPDTSRISSWGRSEDNPESHLCNKCCVYLQFQTIELNCTDIEFDRILLFCLSNLHIRRNIAFSVASTLYKNEKIFEPKRFFQQQTEPMESFKKKCCRGVTPFGQG